MKLKDIHLEYDQLSATQSFPPRFVEQMWNHVSVNIKEPTYKQLVDQTTDLVRHELFVTTWAAINSICFDIRKEVMYEIKSI